MSARRPGRTSIVLAILFAAAVSARVAGFHDPQRRGVAPLTPPTLVGADLYDLYCASCHGATGTGNGPVAAALVTPPADLTNIACRNGGVFPADQMRDYITGARRITAHGTTDMPVWGDILRGLDPSDARVRVRIDNLTAHVRSLQAAPARPGAACGTADPAAAR